MTGWRSSESVPDQTGKSYLVTGANSGLGYEAARALAGKGARVFLGCRNQAKGAEAMAKIREGAPGAALELLQMDLADLSSLRAASQQLTQRAERLDGLINNAGLMALPYSTTKDGFEMQIGTNHLGHFALTSLVLPLLVRTGGARVVTVSSLVHKFGNVVVDDLFFQRRRYDKWLAYGQSKLANLLFALELDRRLKAKNLDVLSLAAHPGYAATELQTKGPRLSGSSLGEWMMKSGNSLFAQTQERGALPELRALTDPGARAGEYYGPSGFMEVAGDAVLVAPAKRALDVELARALWERSVELTGEDFSGLL